MACVALLCGAAASAQQTGAAGSWTLLRTAGGPLEGEIAGFDAATGHLILRGGADAIERIPVDTLREARRTVIPPMTQRAGLWRVELANGDRFASDGVTMDGDRVRVVTAFAGETTLPRSAVRRLIQSPDRRGRL